MATLINNAGVQHYANKMVLAENRKVGSKSLPTALNDIDLALDEMKNLFDAEYGSALDMKLENTENIFSVGTGSGVDKKADVENSFTDVEIKGTTLVNIYGKGFSDVANISNGVGEIVDDGYYKLVANGSYRNAFLKKGKFPMKPSTVYTVVMFVRKETLVGSKQFILSDGASDSPFKDSRIDLNGIGTYTKKVTTLSDFDSKKCGFRGYIPPQTTSGELEFKVMLLEGDWTNYPIPNYFEGMKSVGEVEGNKIEVLSRGKNLFNPQGVKYKEGGVKIVSIEKDTITITQTTDGSWKYVEFDISYLKPNTKYKLSVQNIEGKTACRVRVFNWNGATEVTHVHQNSKTSTFTTPSDVKKLSLLLYTSYNLNETIGATAIFKGVQIELGEYSSPYELPKIDKKQISLNEPLRGLPNGVKDSIEKINGEWKIVRRCGEIILNGSEDWSKVDYNHNDLCTRIDLTIPTNSDRSDLVCNNIPVCADDNIEKENFYIAGHNHKNRFVIILPNSKLSSATIEGAKEWLSKNNATVIYLLPTPIIEDISPVTLQAWKNGTISIDEVLPVESTHTVALNKPAQIKRNIEELTVLRKRVQALEDFYDQVALEQSHQLSLINNSIELDYDI